MEEFEIRRNKLFEKMEDNSVLLLFAGSSKIQSEDEFFPFQSNRHFFYLTNINQENSVLMMVKGVGENKTYLFVDEYNAVKEKWTGKRLSMQEASELSSITNVYATNNFDSMLDMALTSENNIYGNIATLYLDLSKELKIGDELTTKDFRDIVNARYPLIKVEDAYPLVTRLRMIKSPYEVENIKKAITTTACAINDLILNMKVGMPEHALADRFEFYGRSHDRSPLAFSSIVATGKNATILHHPIEQQTDQIEPNDLVLFDIGLSHNGYSADISRTYPVLGTYSETQKSVYEAVLTCNKAVIEYSHAGLTLKDLQEYAIKILTRECVNRGLMKKDDDIKKYYYHSVSHHLGLDTHDASFRELPLEAGNVITVEPGLYFAELGIGVRIEDDILITDSKSEVLSRDIKKEIIDIEKIFRSKANL